MRFILKESNAKYILNEADDNIEIKFEDEESADWDAAAEVDDFKDEILKAQKANNKQLVELLWNKYYEQTAKAIDCNAEDLKNLGTAFRVECMELGFNKTLNPFLTYLQNAGKDLIQKMTSPTYGTIHNNYSPNGYGGKITKANLEAKNNEDLIFQADLFNHKPNEITEYLALQQKVINEAAKSGGIKAPDPADPNKTKSITAWEWIKANFFNGDKLLPIDKIKTKLASISIDPASETKQTIRDDKDIDGIITSAGAMNNKFSGLFVSSLVSANTSGAKEAKKFYADNSIDMDKIVINGLAGEELHNATHKIETVIKHSSIPDAATLAKIVKRALGITTTTKATEATPAA